MPQLKIKVPREKKDDLFGSFSSNITSNITLTPKLFYREVVRESSALRAVFMNASYLKKRNTGGIQDFS